MYYLNNKMLSMVIHAGYVGGEIAEKIHNPRYVHFFCNDRYLGKPHESSKSKKEYYCLFMCLHLSLNKLID